MVLIPFASGTAALTVGTETFVSSPDVPGEYRLMLDLAALANGDVLEIGVYKKVLAGGTVRAIMKYPRYGDQPEHEQIWASEWIPNDLAESNAVRFGLLQTFGTGRSIPWTVFRRGGTHQVGTVVSDGGNTASTFKTDLAETSTDHWKDAFCTFLTGALKGQTHRVSAYNGSTKFLTVETAFSAAPAAGEKFLLVNV